MIRDSDWNSDPELKAMREEFIESLGPRAKKLRAPSDLEVTRFIAHNLAGSAQSFGFASLSEAGGVLDDYLTLEASLDRGLVARFARFLGEMMEKAAATRVDPADMLQHAVMDELRKKIISADGSLPAGAKPGSS